MVLVKMEYDVPAEKQADYIKATNEQIKPFWESIGCKAYDIWQVAENETKFVKTMLFEDMPGMKETMANKDADPVKATFFQFAENVSRMVCTKKT